jgi:hypothetical protein
LGGDHGEQPQQAGHRPAARSGLETVARERPARDATSSSNRNRFNRLVRSCSGNVAPAPVPVSRKCNAVIAAVSVATDPTPVSRRLIVCASTQMQSASVFCV